MSAKLFKFIPRKTPASPGGGIVLPFARKPSLTERFKNEQDYFPTRGAGRKWERSMGNAV